MRDIRSSICRGIAIFLLIAAAVLYCVAMVDTVYTTDEQGIQGYWIFLTGWLGFTFFQFAWYANPLTVLSLLLMRSKPWWALLSSALALLCMSQAFLFYEIPADAKGNAITIISRGAGFYCWIAAISCVFYAIITTLVYRAFNREQSPAKAPANSTPAPRYAAQNSINTAPLSFPNGAISTKTNP